MGFAVYECIREEEWNVYINEVFLGNDLIMNHSLVSRSCRVVLAMGEIIGFPKAINRYIYV